MKSEAMTEEAASSARQGAPEIADAGQPSAEHVISVADVTKRYGSKKEVQVTAVDTVSLAVSRGEFVVITGRSGSGKTTLLNLISGLTTPTAGHVVLDGVELWSLSDRQRSRLRNEHIGFVFQFPSLVPSLNVLENVMLPRAFGGNHVGDDVESRARMLLSTVGLEEKAAAHPRQLSAGQQQRVVLARSLVNRPTIILADEPSSNLDETTEQEIMELFERVHETTGVTILMVTHTSQLISWGTRSVRMAAGRIIGDEPVAQARSTQD
ncbi:MAG: ABC transporter ATP-binding protein [Coriobacteriia bacterium]|nr:ABC transporter ATP-binding protein [Coriobacteriia bacterium]